MSQLETANDKVRLSAEYVAEGTYPADICVLRYALERNARTKPEDIFAAFEGGERWTFAQTLQQVESFAGNLHELGVRQGDHGPRVQVAVRREQLVPQRELHANVS